MCGAIVWCAALRSPLLKREGLGERSFAKKMTHNLNNKIAIVTGGDFSFPSPHEPESEMSSSTFRDFFSLRCRA